jgi:hypothetical protein
MCRIPTHTLQHVARSQDDRHPALQPMTPGHSTSRMSRAPEPSTARMHLTSSEILHLKRALSAHRLWQGLRWVLATVLANLVIAHLAGINAVERIDLVLLASLVLGLNWRGLCRAPVLHTLHRLASNDAHAREQLMAAGIHSFTAAEETDPLPDAHKRT